MKVEDTENQPVFNPLNPEGQRSQGESADVTHILLDNGNIIPIIKGSFHYYVTKTQKPMPFVSFDTLSIGNPQHDQVTRVEIFPNAVNGVAYYVKDEKGNNPA